MAFLILCFRKNKSFAEKILQSFYKMDRDKRFKTLDYIKSLIADCSMLITYLKNFNFTTSLSFKKRQVPLGKSFLFNPAKVVLSSFSTS